MTSVASRALIAPIRFYQRYISPLKGPTCRFLPTCSEYAVEAIRIHGAWRGTGMAIWRVLKCNPFGPHGYDPVPPRRRTTDNDENYPDNGVS